MIRPTSKAGAAASAAPTAAKTAQPAAAAEAGPKLWGTREAARVPDAAAFGGAKAATPEDVMRGFYAAFTSHRPDDLEKLYAPDVKFKDAVFEYSDRAGTMNMWRSILKSPDSKFRFEFDRIEGDVAHGRWVADYKLFGRPVHNEITTKMVVRDGKIVEHTDSFDWNKWVRQALPLGSLPTTKIGRAIVTHLLRAAIDR